MKIHKNGLFEITPYLFQNPCVTQLHLPAVSSAFMAHFLSLKMIVNSRGKTRVLSWSTALFKWLHSCFHPW